MKNRGKIGEAIIGS